ncbi:unnamed protein product [Rhodiola kirilowii]
MAFSDPKSGVSRGASMSFTKAMAKAIDTKTTPFTKSVEEHQRQSTQSQSRSINVLHESNGKGKTFSNKSGLVSFDIACWSKMCHLGKTRTVQEAVLD